MCRSARGRGYGGGGRGYEGSHPAQFSAGHPALLLGSQRTEPPDAPRHGVGMFQLTCDGMNSVKPSAEPMASHLFASAVVHAPLSKSSQRAHWKLRVRWSNPVALNPALSAFTCGTLASSGIVTCIARAHPCVISRALLCSSNRQVAICSNEFACGAAQRNSAGTEGDAVRNGHPKGRQNARSDGSGARVTPAGGGGPGAYRSE